MPSQVLPNETYFDIFERYMVKENFRRITGVEFSSSFKRLGLKAPRPRKGRETGFVYHANGLTVVVWTTYLSLEKQARQEDAGWVLITDGDRAKYFSHPMRRTKNFLPTLFKHSLIAKERVLTRPLCPLCSAFMEIVTGKGLKSRYWQCRSNKHPNIVQNRTWDFGLSRKTIEFLKSERKARRRYRKQRLEAGLSVGQAMLGRKPWQRTQLIDRT